MSKVYYCHLLTKENDFRDVIQEVFESVSKNLPTSERELLEALVLLSKLHQAPLDLAKGRVLGPDGIPSKFLITFWDKIEQTLLDILNTGIREGNFHFAIVKGCIVLIPKKGHQNLLSNKCPITLLNVIYKILTKVFQTRLTGVLQSFILLNQSAFLPRQYTPLHLTH